MEAALEQIKRGDRVGEPEARALDYLGNRFIWRPAFSAGQLIYEFGELLIRAGLIASAERASVGPTQNFLALHALTVMHGSSIALGSGQKARLFAGFSNQDRWLEVKVDIVFSELDKPMMTPICLFLTDLLAEDHCAPALVTSKSVLPDFWQHPIEIAADGRLAFLS